MRTLHSIIRLAISTVALTFFASAAQAELDGDENTIEKDRAHFAARKTLRKSLKYSVYDLESNAHTVHEYVDSKGHVFAVSWKGELPPNLATILGAHHIDYVIKRITTPSIKGQRNFQTIETSKIKVLQSGHMGYWSGQAYLIGQTPPGFSFE